MVGHGDDDPEDPGGVAVSAHEHFHVAAASSGREGGGEGGADGGFGVLGPVEGGDPGDEGGGLGRHGGVCVVLCTGVEKGIGNWVLERQDGFLGKRAGRYYTQRCETGTVCERRVRDMGIVQGSKEGVFFLCV